MSLKYINTDEKIKVGDIFTDGYGDNLMEYRRKNKAKVIYVDRFNLLWYPLNDFTTHNNGYKTNTYCLSSDPYKLDMKDLDEKEILLYNKIDSLIEL